MNCDQQRFERDVAQHQMTVIRNDGIDRHIKFRRDGDSAYWFEILTWPGVLCIRGDMGAYVFSRLPDMFTFFRTDDRGDPSRLYINPGYWCEKLLAVDCDGYGKGAAKRFDADSFKQRVRERFDSHLEGCDVTDEKRADLWSAIESDILDYACDGDTGVWSRLGDFHDDDFPSLFDDCWEWNCEEFTFHAIWNLYAIAWAIRKYDAALTPPPNTAQAELDSDGSRSTTLS